MNKCVYLRIRQKNRQIYYYCANKRENVQKCCHIGCLEKEYKKYKQLKQKSDKQKSLEENRFSILQNSLNKCYFCNNKATDWHELLKGRNRKKCIEWGLCVRVCRNCHSRTENDSKFYQGGRILAQKVWQDYYNKSEDDFIKEFGRSYL